MKIVVTGGAGFIGRYVVDHAKRAGHEVWTFDHPSDVQNVGDIDAEFEGAEHVIHLAGVLGTHELFDTPHMAVKVNVLGTLNVLEWCRHNRAGYTGILMPDVFPSIYTATKVAGARLASAYHHSHDVPVSHVRAFNAYGPGQKHGPGHPQKIIPTFAVEAWSGRPIPIWGDGEQTVDLIHADDLGRMLVDAVRFGEDDVFDGGSGEALTVNQVADAIADYVAVRQHREPIPHQYLQMRRGELPTTIVATGEGWGRLGWCPRTAGELLLETVDAYGDWLASDG